MTLIAVLGLTQVRSDYKDDGTNILLDANENAYGPGLSLTGETKSKVNGASDSPYAIDIDLLGLNRYPDPYARRSVSCAGSTRLTHAHAATKKNSSSCYAISETRTRTHRRRSHRPTYLLVWARTKLLMR